MPEDAAAADPEAEGRAEGSFLGAVIMIAIATATVTTTAAAEAIRTVSCRRDSADKNDRFMADTPLKTCSDRTYIMYHTTILRRTQTQRQEIYILDKPTPQILGSFYAEHGGRTP